MYKLLIPITGTLSMILAISIYEFSAQYAILMGINLITLMIVVLKKHKYRKLSFLPLYLYTATYLSVCIYRNVTGKPYELFSPFKAILLSIEIFMIVRIVAGRRNSLAMVLRETVCRHIRVELIMVSLLDIGTMILEKILSDGSVGVPETILRILGNTSVYAFAVIIISKMIREEQRKNKFCAISDNERA